MLILNMGFNEKQDKFMGYSPGTAASGMGEAVGTTKHEKKDLEASNKIRGKLVGDFVGHASTALQAWGKQRELNRQNEIGEGGLDIFGQSFKPAVGDETQIWRKPEDYSAGGQNITSIEYTPQFQELLEDPKNAAEWAKQISKGGSKSDYYSSLVDAGYASGIQTYDDTLYQTAYTEKGKLDVSNIDEEDTKKAKALSRFEQGKLVWDKDLRLALKGGVDVMGSSQDEIEGELSLMYPKKKKYQQ